MNANWLVRNVTTSAYAWLLERADGVALGFVSHDRDVIVDGFRYRAAPGMIPSTIALSDSLDIDSVEIEGVMSDSAIAETDLLAGRWNGARLEISLIDWQSPNNPPQHLITGEFGEIVQSGDAFRVEMLGLSAGLDEPIAPSTSPTCRAQFGDKLCKISLQKYRAEVAVLSVSEDYIVLDSLNGDAAIYTFGKLRWLNGSNCGLESGISRGEGGNIWLSDPAPFPITSGDRVLLTQGCDKNFSTCRDRFDNSLNFRGEPYLPGNDLLTRYPGA